KLIKVPSRIYSVSFLSLEFVRSPNLKIDLAANKYPIPSKKFTQIKITIQIRSRIQIYFPASFRESVSKDSSFSFNALYHLLKNNFNRIGATEAIIRNAIIYSITFSYEVGNMFKLFPK